MMDLKWTGRSSWYLAKIHPKLVIEQLDVADESSIATLAKKYHRLLLNIGGLDQTDVL